MATEFLHNVQHIRRDLILGDYARQREAGYQLRIQELENHRDALAVELAGCRTDASRLAGELFEAKDRLGAADIRTRRARRQLWTMRGAVVLYVVLRLRGVVP